MTKKTNKKERLTIYDVSKRYGRCSKCGIKFDSVFGFHEKTAMCVMPVTYRTSGICGGEIKIISEQEFNDC